MLKKKKFLIGGLILVLAVGYLAFTGLQNSATYYYTVSELNSRRASVYGETLRVNGLVSDGSVVQDTAERAMSFVLVDGDGQDSLPVAYQGTVPDTFKTGIDVVVEGSLNPNGVFEASSILTKCPSKYVTED